jgi:hypothetical protein
MAFYGRLFLEALFLLWLFIFSPHTLFVAYYERLFLKHSFFFGLFGATLSQALLLLCLLEELAKKY